MSKFFTISTCKTILILFLLGSLPTLLTAQGLWQPIKETSIPGVGTRYIVPTQYKTFKLDLAQMRAALDKAPMTRTAEVKAKPAFVDIPWPDGSIKTFQIIESPIMEQGLMDMFPEIKTYAGAQVGDESRYIRLDLTPQGFHAMVLTAGEGTVYIDPYTFGGGDIEHYICYFKRDFISATNKRMVCDVVGNDVNTDDFRPDPQGGARYGTCELRTYRLALSATGEYTAFHGGTVALAQAAQVTTMNRVNGVFLRDMAIQMNIIANNNLIVYTNAGTDPFTNGTPGTMIGQNQINTDIVIGSASYDIGHVFGTNSGGLAGLGVICSGGNKARGVTGSGAPIGDPFDIDYVAHEMGHQFGGNHTFNNSCGGNRNGATAMEPGSATSIMGYAGICAPDIQSNSDDYFHGISLEEISNRILSTTCPVKTPLSNSTPTILSTNVTTVTLPISTPFALTAVATDPNATNVLTYCWEQMDNIVSTQPPVATATGGPNFRSLNPSTNPTRYFPNLSSLATGGPYTWEVLPSVNRTMNFRVSVRDNALGGSCSDHENVSLSFTSTAGPFVVTYPSATGITWTGNTSQTVTWSVANTDIAPVSCANVDILLSTDGGLTYPTILASNVPNDGSQIITVPNTPSTTARIMVICSNGTFFDVSDNNFTIAASTFDYTLTVTPTALSVCSPNNAVYNISIGSVGGYNDSVTMSLTGVPAGAMVNFSTNPVIPAGTSILTLSNISGVTPGIYSMTLTTTSASGIKIQILTLTVSDPTTAVTLLTPINGATAVPTPTNFSWTAAPGTGVTYEIDISTSATFIPIVDNATGLTTNAFTSTILSSNTTYYWRVRATNACGTTPYTTTFSFTTNNCITYMSTVVPVAISATGTPTVTSTINVPISGAISDINVVNLVGTHTYMSDLVFSLASPAATSRNLMSGICTSLDNFNINFDDAGLAYTSIPCPPTSAGTYAPQNTLAAFNGQNPNGIWTLTIADGFDQDGGSLTSWGLQVCAAVDYTLTVPQPNDTVCAFSNAVYTINIGQSGTYIDPVTLAVTGLPAPAIASFSTNPVTPIGSSTLTISNLGTVAPGTYNLSLNTTSTAGPKTQALILVVLGLPATTTLLTPANLATGVSTSTSFTWNAVAGTGITYTIEISTNATFTAIVDNATGLTTTNYISSSLIGGTTYYWRVRATNACGTGANSSTFSFTTSNCTTVMSTNVPVNMPAVGTGTSTLTFPISGTITDVNIIDVAGTHTRINQITVSVSSPAATSATLWNQICALENNFDVSFDDAAAPGALPCPPVGGGTYRSQTALSVFNGQNPSGIWTLTIVDNSGTGQAPILQSWGVEVCTATCDLTGTTSAIAASCAGGNNGTATVSASLGTPGYTYLWSAGNQTTATATGLAAGTYNVTVSDAGTCVTTLVATVTQPTAVTATIASSTNATCNGSSTGAATANGTGGTGTKTYLWSNGLTTAANTGLVAGVYCVTATDINGCSSDTCVTITEPSTIGLTAITTNSILCNGGTEGSVFVMAIGGTGAFTYNWSNGQTNATATGLAAGLYTVTVTDANGCEAVIPVVISEPTALIGAAIDNTDGTLTASASGGTPTYSYQWDTAAGNQTTATATGLIHNNSYTVTITDANGCTTTATVTVTIVGLEDIPNLSEFNILPNPNTGEFLIQVSFAQAQDATIKLTNILGQELRTYHYSAASFNIPIDIQYQASGVYFVTLQTDNKAITRKVVVAK